MMLTKFRIKSLLYIISIFFIFHANTSVLAKDAVIVAGDIGRYAIPAFAAIVPLAERDYPGFGQAVISIAAVQLATEGLKRIVQEPRPDGGSNLSFPSGHVSAAFSGAAFINRRYGFIPSIPLYALSAFVGYSRLHTSSDKPQPAHHVQDVLVGAALGVAIPWLITRPYLSSDKVNIEPQISRNYTGMKLSASW